ncbi:MAG TPA: aminotransferase class V-fold PLP-dependent enzyme [Negativicutes bacterium]|nr:aminotransferase class V-fold PLP-dependent enzyme [Negativicutes bacterium]
MAKIEELLAANPKVKVVAMVFHETSTGMINPVKEVGALCKKYNKWYHVDSVSAAAGERIDVVENNITFTTSVGGKCVCAKESHQTPNTPNVTLFWALNQALKNIHSEGLDSQIARYKKCAAMLCNGMKDLGLKLLLPEEHMSNTVTSVFLPEGKDLDAFIKAMESRGYVVYPGKGKYMKMGMFQVANMGEIYEDDCREFLKVLKDCLK